ARGLDVCHPEEPDGGKPSPDSPGAVRRWVHHSPGVMAAATRPPQARHRVAVLRARGPDAVPSDGGGPLPLRPPPGTAAGRPRPGSTPPRRCRTGRAPEEAAPVPAQIGRGDTAAQVPRS